MVVVLLLFILRYFLVVFAGFHFAFGILPLNFTLLFQLGLFQGGVALGVGVYLDEVAAVGDVGWDGLGGGLTSLHLAAVATCPHRHDPILLAGAVCDGGVGRGAGQLVAQGLGGVRRGGSGGGEELRISKIAILNSIQFRFELLEPARCAAHAGCHFLMRSFNWNFLI